MPGHSGYVVRETGSNLARNPIMTIAAIVVMSVSLTAVAAVLLMRQEVNKAAIEWKGGVELAIFLKPQATASETAAIGHELDATPGVKSVRYVNQQGAYKEFKTMFQGEPELVSVVTPTDLPSSYRIVPVNASNIQALGNQFKDAPGVATVQYAQKEINSLLSHFNDLRLVAYVVALAVMIGATALIINTIQLAIFARRREVAVMKLVGATNWFIRVPVHDRGLDPRCGRGAGGVRGRILHPQSPFHLHQLRPDLHAAPLRHRHRGPAHRGGRAAHRRLRGRAGFGVRRAPFPGGLSSRPGEAAANRGLRPDR